MSSFGGEDAQIVLPGQLLVEAREANEHEVGIGAYISTQGDVRSCQVGVVVREDVDNKTNASSKAFRWSVVPPSITSSDMQIVSCDAVLKIGDVVLCRVVKLMLNQISCDIIAVDDMKLRTSARGVVRREDIRQTETDQVCILDCFRPGDILRATILSLGDSKQYFLSTADKDGGVRFAMSKSGNVMQPVSWLLMSDPLTGLTEARKVAMP
jgi:exosome complex component CSL4